MTGDVLVVSGIEPGQVYVVAARCQGIGAPGRQFVREK